jgi:thiol:disulfide interchange protein
MQPIVNGLEAEYSDQMNFLYMNANAEGRTIFQSLNLPGHPAILIFTANGQETYRVFGVVEADSIRSAIENILTPNE